MSRTIEILKGFPNGHLTMSDNGYSRVPEGSSIRWKINDQSDADSLKVTFFNIQIKDESNDEIFSENPMKDGKEWKAKIKNRDVANKTCEYGIFWTDDKGGKHYFDPIIAVKPSSGGGSAGGSESMQKMIIGAMVGLIAFFSVKFLLKRLKQRSSHNESFDHGL